jgi:Phosphotransferase System HPr (HPr) Family
MKSFEYAVKDKMGLHARPAGLLVKEANGFTSAIRIVKGEKEADAKKIFGIMGLAVKCGETVTICADGEDEDTAIAELEAFVKENF